MRFARNFWPQVGNCFVLMPSGEQIRDGQVFNWDSQYQEVIEPVIREIGMTPLRADQIYGVEPYLDRLWQGIQEAEVIVADVTGRNSNALYEFALAQVLGKRILILTMDPDDVPVGLSEFVQIHYSKDGTGLLQLARELPRHLEAARQEPSTEAMLTPLPAATGGAAESVPARVLHVTPTFATIETQDGRRGFLNAEDFSWTRRPRDLTRVLRGCLESHEAASLRIINRIMAMRIIASLVSMRTS